MDKMKAASILRSRLPQQMKRAKRKQRRRKIKIKRKRKTRIERHLHALTERRRDPLSTDVLAKRIKIASASVSRTAKEGKPVTSELSAVPVVAVMIMMMLMVAEVAAEVGVLG